MSQPLWYVYGVVSSDLAAAALPQGLDDAPVALESEDGVAALVSRLPASDYTPNALEAKTGDVEWLSPRAVAHDRVLTWASDRGAVIPLPMFSLFSGEEAVRTMLRDRMPELERVLARVSEGREYALRVYRVDADLLDAIVTLSPRLQELARTAGSASPGQRYLLERKLDGEKKLEMRSVTASIVEEIVDTLRVAAVDVFRSPIARSAENEATRGTLVLNAAFLVAPAVLERFRRALTSLVETRGTQGFRFDFTGPWPPYHFASEPVDGH